MQRALGLASEASPNPFRHRGAVTWTRDSSLGLGLPTEPWGGWCPHSGASVTAHVLPTCRGLHWRLVGTQPGAETPRQDSIPGPVPPYTLCPRAPR